MTWAARKTGVLGVSLSAWLVSALSLPMSANAELRSVTAASVVGCGAYWAKETPDTNGGVTLTLSRYEQEAVSSGEDVCFEYREQLLWSRQLRFDPQIQAVSARGHVAGTCVRGLVKTEHALVVWDPNGHLVVDCGLEDLLPGDEIRAFALHSQHARAWTIGAQFSFDSGGGLGDVLLVKLDWGRQLVVDLDKKCVSSIGPSSALPAPLSGFSDEALFTSYERGKRARVTRCRWEEDGHISCQAVTVDAGGSSVYRFVVVPDQEGRWQRVSRQSGSYACELLREGTLAQRTCKPSERGSTTAAARSIEPRTVLTDRTHAPILWSQLVRLFKMERARQQPFNLLWPDGKSDSILLAYIGCETHVVSGDTLNVYLYESRDEVIWCNSDAKVYMVEVPENRIVAVRQGYDVLRERVLYDTSSGWPAERRAIPWRASVE